MTNSIQTVFNVQAMYKYAEFKTHASKRNLNM
jgi:hypothetical protein